LLKLFPIFFQENYNLKIVKNYGNYILDMNVSSTTGIQSIATSETRMYKDKN